VRRSSCSRHASDAGESSASCPAPAQLLAMWTITPQALTLLVWLRLCWSLLPAADRQLCHGINAKTIPRVSQSLQLHPHYVNKYSSLRCTHLQYSGVSSAFGSTLCTWRSFEMKRVMQSGWDCLSVCGAGHVPYCDLVQNIGVASLGADEIVCLCVVQVMYPCWQTPPTVTWYKTLEWHHWVLMRSRSGTSPSCTGSRWSLGW